MAEPLPRHRALSTARRVHGYEQLVTLVARATRGAATPDQWQISPARTRPRQTARSGLIRFGRCTGRTLAPPRRKDCNHRVSDGKQRSAHAQGRCGLSLPLPWTPALVRLAALCACCLVVRRSLFSPWFCSVNLFVWFLFSFSSVPKIGGGGGEEGEGKGVEMPLGQSHRPGETLGDA